jgi:hypothetical protein
MRFLSLFVIFAVVSVVSSASASYLPAINKVIDGRSALADGSGAVGDLTLNGSLSRGPLLDGTTIVLQAYAADGSNPAIYSVDITGSNLRRLVSSSTALPGSGTFDGANALAARNGIVAFNGYALGQAPNDFRPGVYAIDPNGGVTLVANRNTPMPGGLNFHTFGAQMAVSDSGQVAFDGYGMPSSTARFGLYAAMPGGSVSKIIDNASTLPGTSGNAGGFGGDHQVGSQEGNVVFSGSDVAGFGGVYRWDGRSLVPLVKRGDPAPGGGTFTTFHDVFADSRGVAFSAKTTASGGYYLSENGAIRQLLDPSVLQPNDGDHVFIENASYAGGILAFILVREHFDMLLQEGVFAYEDGSLIPIVPDGIYLDGKQVVDVYFGQDGMDVTGSAVNLAIGVRFSDNTGAIYNASLPVPEPAAAGFLVLFAWGVLARCRHSRPIAAAGE